MSYRLVLCLSAVFLLTACATEGITTNTGKNIGKAEWQPLDYQENAQLVLPSQVKDIIANADYRKFTGRYQERYIFQNNQGFAQMEMVYRGGFKEMKEDKFRGIFTGMELFGQAVTSDEVVMQKTAHFTYAEFNRDAGVCYGFYKGSRAVDEIRGGGNAYKAYIIGVFCNEPTDDLFDSFAGLLQQVELK